MEVRYIEIKTSPAGQIIRAYTGQVVPLNGENSQANTERRAAPHREDRRGSRVERMFTACHCRSRSQISRWRISHRRVSPRERVGTA